MSTSPASRSRRPAGTPIGGQFAPEAHAEPEVALDPDADPSDQSPGSRREVASNGIVRWYDADGQLHRDGGPAVEHADGTTTWYQHGQLHRDDGPAVEWPDATRWWYQHGQIHRDDGPAVEFPDGAKAWLRHGQLHRDGGPAIERPGGYREWHQHGDLHRDDGPAVEWPSGATEFWVRGRRLTEDEFRQASTD